MKKPISIILLVVVVGSILFWLIRGRVVVVRLQGRELSDVVDLNCFAGLRPDMKRSQIHAVMGEPDRVHVTDIEYDEDGEIEYQEIRWAYLCKGGVLAYYVEEYDVPGGSVEYVPENMRVSDFFRLPVHVGFGERFVEVQGGDRHLLTVQLKSRDRIEKINWYWSK